MFRASACVIHGYVQTGHAQPAAYESTGRDDRANPATTAARTSTTKEENEDNHEQYHGYVGQIVADLRGGKATASRVEQINPTNPADDRSTKNYVCPNTDHDYSEPVDHPAFDRPIV
jgi:hypothetical protein